MTISAALVLFAVIWFMCLFIALPIGIKSQGDAGKIVPGTHASSPINPNLKKKAIWVTVVTILLWVPICWIIVSGIIPMSSLVYLDGIDGAY